MSLAMVLVEYPAASANSMRERIEMSICLFPFFIVFLLVSSAGIGGVGNNIRFSQGELNATGCPHGGIRKEELIDIMTYSVICLMAELMQPPTDKADSMQLDRTTK